VTSSLSSVRAQGHHLNAARLFQQRLFWVLRQSCKVKCTGREHPNIRTSRYVPVTNRAVLHSNKQPHTHWHGRHVTATSFSPQPVWPAGRLYLSEFSQFLLQVENLKHAQPRSSEGQQDQQEDHQEADTAPLFAALWLFPPIRYRWWEGSDRGCWMAGGTGVGTAIHPKDLWVHIVQVLLHGWEWDGLDALCVVFHVAAKNCRGWPRLSPGGRPSSASVCLHHHSSSDHPAQTLQLYESLKRQQQTPKSFRSRLQVQGTRLLLPHCSSTHMQLDRASGRLHSHSTSPRKEVNRATQCCQAGAE